MFTRVEHENFLRPRTQDGLRPKLESKMVSNDQELVQSEPKSCPQNQNPKEKI